MAALCGTQLAADLPDLLARGRRAPRRGRTQARWRTACRDARRGPAAAAPRRRLRARPATTRRSTRRRALRDESRRVVAALQARYAEESGVKALQDQAQQRARLFRRGAAAGRRGVPQAAAARDFRPSPDHGGRHALLDGRAVRASNRPSPPPPSARSRASSRSSTRSPRAALADAAAIRAATEAARGDRCRRGACRAGRGGGAGCRPLVDGSLAFRIEGGRHPSSSRRSARSGKPFIANDCDLSGSDGGRDLAPHGPEHGGQVDLPRQNALIADPCPDRLLRARPRGPYRRRRQPLLPRRRRRRPRPRPLDLHGGDGRDGGHPQSGRRALARHPRRDRARERRPSTGSPSPGRRSSACMRSIAAAHSVRDALPRAHPALEGAAAPAQRHHARHRVERRRRASSTRSWPEPPTAPTASRWPSSPACRTAVVERAREILARLEANDREAPKARLIDDLPLFAAARPAAAPENSPRRDRRGARPARSRRHDAAPGARRAVRLEGKTCDERKRLTLGRSAAATDRDARQTRPRLQPRHRPDGPRGRDRCARP